MNIGRSQLNGEQIYDIILLDTCSILADAFELCMQKLLRSRNKSALAIPCSVRDELRYLAQKPNSNCRAAAVRALEGIDALISAGYVGEIGSTESPEMGDFSILKYVVQHCVQDRILVITQDRNLTADLRRLNLIRSLPIHPVNVLRIEKDGSLEVLPDKIFSENLRRTGQVCRV